MSPRSWISPRRATSRSGLPMAWTSRLAGEPAHAVAHGRRGVRVAAMEDQGAERCADERGLVGACTVGRAARLHEPREVQRLAVRDPETREDGAKKPVEGLRRDVMGANAALAAELSHEVGVLLDPRAGPGLDEHEGNGLAEELGQEGGFVDVSVDGLGGGPMRGDVEDVLVHGRDESGDTVVCAHESLKRSRATSMRQEAGTGCM